MSDETKYKEDLEKFNGLTAKILYIIYHGFKIEAIDENQKRKLKEFALCQHPKVVKAYHDFEKTFSLTDGAAELKKIYTGDIQVTVNKDHSKSIIHKAFENIKNNVTMDIEEEDNNNNEQVSFDKDEKEDDSSSDDNDNNNDDLEGGGSPIGGLVKIKKKQSDKKTYISNAIRKMEK